MRQTMNHHPDNARTERSDGTAATAPRTTPGPGHDPRAATGNGIGTDPAREAAPAGADPTGGPGTAPASEDGLGRRSAGREPEDTAVGGPDRHNATETDPSGTSTPPGHRDDRHPTDAAARPHTPPAGS
ncbi:hypothetical protein [Streptomyces sp. NPDC021020]|uniref:hypothetical protein n=1 Tax=Streptomyces sp. NPDC021020 TaxID=3365109 RepID=UPI0037978265